MNIYDSIVAAESRHFIGTEHWYRHFFGILYTDGVQWLAEKLNCYWLIDEIAWNSRKFWKEEQFFSIEFTSPEKGKGLLNITDGDGHSLANIKYDFTDLFVNRNSFGSTKKEITENAKIRFLLVYGGDFKKFVLMLPSEY